MSGTNEPVIANSFYNHTPGNPAVGVGQNLSLNPPDVTPIEDLESYFYDNANPPENAWDFARVWAFPGGVVGVAYPEFKFEFCDTTPPVIASITANPAVVWPPNHKMVKVAVNVNATDDYDPAPVCVITGVDVLDGGCKSQYASVGTIGGLSVMLRAERCGSRHDRVYVIKVSCTDAQGNVSTGTVDVTVPHDLRSYP